MHWALMTSLAGMVTSALLLAALVIAAIIAGRYDPTLVTTIRVAGTTLIAATPVALTTSAALAAWEQQGGRPVPP